jgi:hypothetical protein
MNLSSKKGAAPTTVRLRFQGGTGSILKVSESLKKEENTMNLYGPKQLADSMRTVRKNTILMADDIPEKEYDYRPTMESRSVAEILVHVASRSRFDHFVHEEEHLSSLEGFDFGALLKKSEAEEKRPRSKSEIITLLRTEGDRWCWVEGLPEAVLSEQVRQPAGASKTGFEMLLGVWSLPIITSASVRLTGAGPAP